MSVAIRCPPTRSHTRAAPSTPAGVAQPGPPVLAAATAARDRSAGRHRVAVAAVPRQGPELLDRAGRGRGVGVPEVAGARQQPSGACGGHGELVRGAGAADHQGARPDGGQRHDPGAVLRGGDEHPSVAGQADRGGEHAVAVGPVQGGAPAAAGVEVPEAHRSRHLVDDGRRGRAGHDVGDPGDPSRPAVEDPDAGAGVQVPHAQRAVAARRDRSAPVGSDPDRGERARMADQHVAAEAGAHVPDTGREVVEPARGGHGGAPRGVDGDVLHRPDVPSQRREPPPGHEVPDPHTTVALADEQDLLVGSEGRDRRVRAGREHPLAPPPGPRDPDRAGVVGDHRRAARRGAERRDQGDPRPAATAAHDAEPPRLQIPPADPPVVVRTHRPAPVGARDDPDHPGRVPASQAPDGLTSRQRVHVDPARRAPEEEPPAVGGDGEPGATQRSEGVVGGQ
ncbi:collagen alpha-1(I) chain-like, partial [Herrania umbratica]|uniref:Collagen alpha-1(I) chain-like n=1 Tax=Herrania umbratica TaxID=108875 RepID=A0A6J1BLS4_9ROSI